MAELGNYRVDSDLCVEGIWCLYDADIELKIARITNPKYMQFLQKLSQEGGGMSLGGSRIARSRRLRRSLGVDDEEDMTDMVDLSMSHHVLLDWKNIQIDGKDIPYSQEKAFTFLQDPELQDLRSFVLVQASDAALFLKESMNEAAGN